MDQSRHLELLNNTAFTITGFFIKKYPPHKNLYLHTKNHALCFVVYGKYKVYLEGKIFTGKEEDVLVLNPGMRISASSESEVKLYIITFLSAEKQFLMQLPLKNELWQGCWFEIYKILTALTGLWNEKHNALKIKSAFYQLLDLLIENHYKNKESECLYIERCIKEIAHYIETKYMENLSLETLSQKAGLTPSYFSKLFKQRMGISPNKYISELRIKRAKELMVSQKCSIKDIALQVGYTDEFYFSNKFKSFVGVSPTVYAAIRRKMIIEGLPINPKRVLATGAGVIDTLLAFDIKPMVFNDHEVPEYLKVKKATRKADNSEQLQPDLIVGAWLDEHQYKTMVKIAPTLNLRGDWREFVFQLGEIFGEQKAKELMELYVSKAKLVKNQIISFTKDKTAMLLRSRSDTGLISLGSGSKWASGIFYHDLGMKHPERFASNFHISLSFSELAQINPDIIILEIVEWADGERYYHEVIKRNEYWKKLLAVQNNKVFLFTNQLITDGGIIGKNLLLDQVLDRLTG